MPKGKNEYLRTTTLIFPLYTDRLNGQLYVTQTGKKDEKTYIVVEIGLFPLPVLILTLEEIKTKYGVKIPKDFRYDSE